MSSLILGFTFSLAWHVELRRGAFECLYHLCSLFVYRSGPIVLYSSGDWIEGDYVCFLKVRAAFKTQVISYVGFVTLEKTVPLSV